VLERIPEKNQGDILLVFSLIILSGIGLAALFSSSYHVGMLLMGDPYFFIKKQVLFLAAGGALAFLTSRISLDWLRGHSGILFLIILLLNLCPLIPGLGNEIMGARRWFFIGPVSIQPSELAKAVLVLHLANLFARNEDRLQDFGNVIVPPLVASFLLAVIIIVLQNDYSTGAMVLLIMLLIFFIARVRMPVIFALLGTMALMAALMLVSKEHRVMRLVSFFLPNSDPEGTGYQLIASQSALSRGSLWGVGLGRGIKKLGALPEVQSDFIFASLGEEIGFFGVLAVVVLFVLFALRGFWLAYHSGDTFLYLLGMGYSCAILFQALCNMAVVIGLVPATGIPLPFFSAGGSALLSAFIMAGFLINISRIPASPNHRRHQGPDSLPSKLKHKAGDRAFRTGGAP
jgi:cell division protein FtsW